LSELTKGISFGQNKSHGQKVKRVAMARISLDNPQYFLNRDTSWLEFNRRVLEEASDEGNPLLERLKFLSISASNLDEFFEVRVAAMMQQIEDGYNEVGPDGLTLTEKRDLLNRLTHEFVDDQYECWNSRLRPALSENGIRVLGLHELDAEALRFVEEYCEKELDPLLTPVTVDPAHPFPRVINKALCLGFLLRRRRRSALTYTGVVSVPRALPRLVRLPSKSTDDFIFLADLVAHHAVRMYHGYDIVSSAPFRVTRNSNLYLAEEEARCRADGNRGGRRSGNHRTLKHRVRTRSVAGVSGKRAGESFTPVQCLRTGEASRPEVPAIFAAGVAVDIEIEGSVRGTARA
jgi:polyphosphate kinase 1